MGVLEEVDGGLRDGRMVGGKAGPLGNGVNHLIDNQFGALDIHLISDF